MPTHSARRRWIPALVLVVGLLATAAATYQIRRIERARERERFDRLVLQTREEIENGLSTHIALLRATAGLFSASEYVSRPEFRNFIERLQLAADYPGVQGIGFVAHARDEQLDALLATIRREVGDSFVIRPDGARDSYDPVAYIEPLNERNSAAVGFDMSTEPVRRAAMERARDTGDASASGPVVLMHEIDESSSQKGFIIYVPLYVGADIPRTIEARRASLVGFVYAPFRVRHLLRTMLPAGTTGVEFSLRDAGAGDDDPMYVSDGFARSIEQAGDLASETPLDFAGRVWRLRFAPGDDFVAARATDLAPFAAGAGTLLSLLLFGLVRVQTSAAARFEESAAVLSASQRELQESEARKGAILECAPDAIISIDDSGRVIEWNPAAEQVFGFPRDAAIGRPLIELIVPERFRDHARWVISELQRKGPGAFAGRRLEEIAMRADGTEFPVEVSVSRIGSSAPPRFTGFFRDITERVRAERHRHLMTRELGHRVKNNLATVMAIVSESARRSDSVPELVHTVGGRLRALAGLHEMLTAGQLQSADIGRLVERTLSPHVAEPNSCARVIAGGAEVCVPGKVASALCMALHELATNAAKYGALSTAAGRVEIGWRRESRDDQRSWLVLTWVESGGPPVSPPAHRGFGSELIQGGVAFETGGHSTLEYAPSGLRCTIEMPLVAPDDPESPPLETDPANWSGPDAGAVI